MASSPPKVRAVYGVAVVVTSVLSLGHAADLATATRVLDYPFALAGILVGIALADFVTGLVHWACDTWSDEESAWIGPELIRGFRDHHRTPAGILQHDWTDVNGQAAFPAGAAFFVMALDPARGALDGHAFVHALLWSFITFSAFTNQLHKWAHAVAPPRPIAALQRSGLLLSRVRHARHHCGDHTRGYCITTGWLNRLLDAGLFWRRCERAVSRLTGARPRAYEKSSATTQRREWEKA